MLKQFLLPLIPQFRFQETIPGETVQSDQISRLSWTNCSADLNFPPAFQCAELKVPLNWDEPTGPQISLFMNKAPATRPEKRIGSLVLNPGGPGAPGAGLVKRIYNESGATLNEYFDFIGPNPRGVSPSTPIQCDPELWNQRMTSHPKSEEDFRAMIDHWKVRAEDCYNRTGPLFHHVDTISAAHDLEAIRIALDEGPLNYWGFSYGTQLGSQYAELYPQNIARMTLDAVVDHSSQYTNFAISELAGFEAVLHSFLNWAAQNTTPALYGKETHTFFDDLVHRADTSPIPAPACKQDINATSPCRPNVTGEDIKFALFDFYLSRPRDTAWPLAAQYLLEASHGNATALSKTWYTQPTHMDMSMLAIGCQDWHANASWEHFLNRDILARSISPHLQGVVWTTMMQAACLGWQQVFPRGPVNLPREMSVRNASTAILLVNALWDPQTPYEWAVNLQRMVEGSVLVTRRGYGHGSVMQMGETQRAVERYFVEGVVPGVGSVYET